MALGETLDGRLAFVVFRRLPGSLVRATTARDMDASERRLFRRNWVSPRLTLAAIGRTSWNWRNACSGAPPTFRPRGEAARACPKGPLCQGRVTVTG